MTDSYLPRWTLKTDGIIMPDERLPMGQTVIMGLQHVVAMFGATVLAPLLMGFDPNVSILFSGIATIIFFFVVGGRVPSYLGSSFAFIGPVLVATALPVGAPNPNIPLALGGIIAAGALYFLIGIDRAGRRAPLGRAADAAGGDRRDRRRDRPCPGADRHLECVRRRGRQPGRHILCPLDRADHRAGGRSGGGLCARLMAAAADPARRRHRLRGLPDRRQHAGLRRADRFRQSRRRRRGSACRPSSRRCSTPSAMALIAPVAIILVAENLGHIKAIGAMTGRNLDPYLGRAFMGDGLATMLSGAAGGTGVTTYAENMGVMAVTRIYSTAVFIVAAVIAILLGFSPKFGALIGTIPGPVLGGLSIVVFGLIAATAGRIWVENRVDFSQPAQPHHRCGRAGARRRQLQAHGRRLHARRHRHRDLRRHHPVSSSQYGTRRRAARADIARRRLGQPQEHAFAARVGAPTRASFCTVTSQARFFSPSGCAHDRR